MGLLWSKPTFPSDSNTVYLVQIPRGKKVPSISPFPMKLETYLRIAKIPHENVISNSLSPKGKTPWIHHRNRDIGDSQFCIEYLNKEFGVNIDEHLTSEEQAISRALLKMLEENFYWVLVCYRWVYSDPQNAGFSRSIPSWLLYLIRRRVKGYAEGQGMGRHSPEEVFHIGKLDLQALSDYLGDKKFFFGDKPCVLDCSVFGMLSQVVLNQTESPHYALIQKEFPNLEKHCHTMRDTFWLDWDEILKSDADSTKL